VGQKRKKGKKIEKIVQEESGRKKPQKEDM
jgi:hypothetical protein